MSILVKREDVGALYLDSYIGSMAHELVEMFYGALISEGFHPSTVYNALIEVGEEKLESFIEC